MFERSKHYFEGSFDTQLSVNTSKGRQLFQYLTYFFRSWDANGSWTQPGYDESVVDGATVYNIAVGGKYSKVVLFLHIP